MTADHRMRSDPIGRLLHVLCDVCAVIGGAVLMAEIARRIGLGFLYERPSWARLAPARATPQATDERKRQQPA